MYEKKNKINDMTKVSHLYNSLNDNKSKIIPFKIVFGNVGNIRYFPPATREWKNSVYSYNQNYMKNLPIYNIIINNLIKNYFNLSFKREFLGAKYIHIPEFLKKKRFSLRKIFVSKAEVKHTNSKALINIFIYNKQKKYYWNYIVGIFLFIYIKIYRIPLFRHLYLPYKSCILKYLHFLANYLFKRDHINPINKGFIYVNIGKMKIMLKNKYKYKKINNQWVLGNQEGKLLVRLELSNSGEALKLWLPLNSTKAICKWINNPFAVTILKMMETEIGNRGSKSIIGMPIKTFVIIVNEQRVEGSWSEKFLNTGPKINQCFSHVRCTLMGFERNYKVSSLSNIIHTYRGYSTKKVLLDYWWITGFTDGEGCFIVSITRNKNLNVGWEIRLFFKINLHERDKELLELMKNYLRVGKTSIHGPQSFQFIVSSLKELKTIIDHFDKYPLITQKWTDFELWKQVFYLMKRGEHLTLDGLRKIVAIRASINQGLKTSPKLLAQFPDVVEVARPQVTNQTIQDPNWLAGFTAGEGCFYIKIFKSKTSKLGETVQLEFIITQHARDKILMKSFIKYLKCGIVNKNKDVCIFRVTKLDDIINKIIPLFQQHPILGVKALDLSNWCIVAEMMKKREHLTQEGLDKIKQIKSGMNRGRKSWSNTLY